MKILKVFNNNSVTAISDELEDIILTGSGIGFQKKIGDKVDESRIEKTYFFKDDKQKRFEQLLKIVPSICFEITNKIVNQANKELETDFSGEIFLAISDHISFAIKRKKDKTCLPNVILSETKVLYQKEYKVGLWALDYIENEIGVHLDEDEAGYIALYLVNFSLNNHANNVNKVVTLTEQVLNVIKTSMKIDLAKDSLGYARISTHLKYLAERIFRNEDTALQDTTSEIRNELEKDLCLSTCIHRIVKLIRDCYNYELSPDEQTYLCIHIKKNVNAHQNKALSY